MLMFSRYSWWVGSMIGLALLLAIMGQTGLLNPFQGLFLTVTSPAERVLTGVFRPVAAVLADAGKLNDLQDENGRLRLENEDLKNQNAELQQGAERVKQLEEALGITQGGGSDQRLAASIVHRDSSVFTDVVSIDKGTNSGVRAGMVVLSSRGTLIGTVTKSLADISFVRLITDSKSKVQAQVQGGTATGTVQGSPGRGLSFNLAEGDIQVGDTLITGGLGGNYPPGLTIGTVSEVSGNSQDLFKTVKLEPLVRLSTARTVLVLTSFLPQRLDLQTP